MTDKSAYNVSAAVKLSGGLSVDSLERALKEIFRRHEVLRTSFPSTLEGEARKLHRKTADVTIPAAGVDPAFDARLAEEEFANPLSLVMVGVIGLVIYLQFLT